MIKKILFTLSLVMSMNVSAEQFVVPPEGIDLVGMIRQVVAKEEDTVLDIGRSFGVGVEAMKNANPGVDVWYPGEGTKVLVPTRYILPDAPHKGIVINLPEMRLYYYSDGGKKVDVYAIGVGREDWGTPVGLHSIIEKKANPTWTPPASIRAEHAAKGDPLPAVVAAGPDNPLGLFAMRLSNRSYLLHGTNKPWGVGMRVSHGCIRLYPEGIEELFGKVARGTSVNIIKQEMKIGWFGDELYLEYHPPIVEDNVSAFDAMAQAIALVNEKAAERGLMVEENLIRAVVNEASGMPVAVASSGR